MQYRRRYFFIRSSSQSECLSRVRGDDGQVACHRLERDVAEGLRHRGVEQHVHRCHRAAERRALLLPDGIAWGCEDQATASVEIRPRFLNHKQAEYAFTAMCSLYWIDVNR